MRSYPHMETVDCRPEPAANGYREYLRYTPGRGWGPPLRDDLILKPWARALGYRVEHHDNNWHHSAYFDLPDRSIWSAGCGWQARDLKGPILHGPRRVYGDRAFSLITALLREAPLLLEHKP